jgi:radical SAM family uncharacterized protein
MEVSLRRGATESREAAPAEPLVDEAQRDRRAHRTLQRAPKAALVPPADDALRNEGGAAQGEAVAETKEEVLYPGRLASEPPPVRVVQAPREAEVHELAALVGVAYGELAECGAKAEPRPLLRLSQSADAAHLRHAEGGAPAEAEEIGVTGWRHGRIEEHRNRVGEVRREHRLARDAVRLPRSAGDDLRAGRAAAAVVQRDAGVPRRGAQRRVERPLAGTAADEVGIRLLARDLMAATESVEERCTPRRDRHELLRQTIAADLVERILVTAPVLENLPPADEPPATALVAVEHLHAHALASEEDGGCEPGQPAPGDADPWCHGWILPSPRRAYRRPAGGRPARPPAASLQPTRLRPSPRTVDSARGRTVEPKAIRSQIEEVLPDVQRPGRYLGLERNLVRKDWEAAEVRLLLAFPDEYGIGMSHQGTRILYHIANRRSDTLCERAFAPWPDMAAAMRERGIPLYSLESYHAAADFDLIGITLQTELNYVNVPYLLDLARIPRFAAERRDGHPLILGGGPCMANPEPVAEFFDAFAVGDGEVILPTFLDAIKAAKATGASRRELLRALARLPGVYVPQLYRWVPAESPARGGRFEVIDEAASLPVVRAFAEKLDPADVSELPLVPAVEVVQDRLGMEVVRGCTQGCRFCQAGYWYRPVREHDPATVLATMEAHVDATGYEEVGLLSLSTADYSQIEPLAFHLADRLAPRRVGVSLPSLRAESFSVAVADAVSRVRKSGFTFAPETGSDRLRRVINKTFTNADMIAAAEVAFARGWNLIKVYAMIGLPTETDDDLEELARLAEGILAAGRRVGNRKAEVKVSVGPFVPKSWTPFQWEPFVPPEELQRRIELLRARFKRIRWAKLTWNDPAEARLEAVLSRGDRRLGAVIARAHDLGAVFDGWREWLKLEAWEQAFAEAGIDVAAELGPREATATLPWDVIDAQVRKGFLKAERRRALLEAETPDCRWGDCVRCGIPGNGLDTRLALPTLPVVGDPAPDRARAKNAAYRLRPVPRVLPKAEPLTQPERTARYRFTFRKVGDARWLSHRNVMDLLERALRAAGMPVRYTEGYNPHIRLSMGPALALGHEALAERFDVECHADVETGMLSRANRVLPEGLQLTACERLPHDAPSLGKAVAACRYRVRGCDPTAPWPPSPPAALHDGVREWRVEGGELVVTLNARQMNGPITTVKSILGALALPTSGAIAPSVRREAYVLTER